MKKLLKLNIIGVFALFSGFNTIACNNKRDISSLENANGYQIKAAKSQDKNLFYSDITYWSSNTINSDNFKTIFMNNFNKSMKNPTQYTYFDMISKMEDTMPNNHNEKVAVGVIPYLLAQYEVSSTNPKISNIRDAYNQYTNDFAVKYYQDNKEITAIQPVDISNKYNNVKVWKLSFSVGINITEQGKKDGFVGARQLITANQVAKNKTDISQEYQDSNSKFLVDVNDKNLIGYNKNDNKVYFTNSSDFDYRFAINIVWNIS